MSTTGSWRTHSCSLALRASVGVALVLLFCALPAVAEEEPSEAARSALQKTNTYPWYDRENDAVRRIDALAKEPSTNDNRASTWEAKPEDESASSPLFSGLGQFFADLVKIGFWLLILVILGVLIWLAIRVFLKMETQQAAETVSQAASSSEVDQVENLPFKVKRPLGDLLAEAQRHHEQGNYRDAIIYLFSHMLVQLDKHQLIRLTKGKTNRQYLWEVRARQRVSQLLEKTMIPFEDVFFGDHQLGRTEFETCWRDLDEFHALVGEGASG